MNNVANCFADLRQYEAALRLHQKTLERRRSRLGPEDFETLRSMNNVAVAYSMLGRHKDSRELHEETLRLRIKTLSGGHRDTLQSMNALAWILANCPDQTQRVPARAVDLANQALKLAPKNGDYWNTLGTAYYRAGDCKSAVEAIQKSTELRKGGDAADWFVLAMAHWHLGNKAESRACYDRAIQWIEMNKRQDEELRLFRAEAGELLGIGRP